MQRCRKERHKYGKYRMDVECNREEEGEKETKVHGNKKIVVCER
jgi:hypothetical protein